MIIASLCYAAGTALITAAVILGRRSRRPAPPAPVLQWSYDGINWEQ